MIGGRCKIGEMGRVARSTTGCACTRREIGKVLYCRHLRVSCFGMWWALSKPEQCPHCGGLVYGYLDADLDPIRPPRISETTKADEVRPVEVQPA